MVERIHVQHVTAYRTTHFEEVDQLTKVVFVDLRHGDTEVRDFAIHMGETGTLTSYLVDFVNATMLQIVQIVEILGILRDGHVMVRIIHCQNSFENLARTFLDVLSEGVQVGGENRSCREDSLMFLALAFAEQLFEPFDEIEKLGLERG